MNKARNWLDVKARARAVDPTWGSASRVARRSEMRERMVRSAGGAGLGEIRKQLGVTRAELAEAAGLAEARIDQIERGDAVGPETLRAYVTGLGGQIDIVAQIGGVRFTVG